MNQTNGDSPAVILRVPEKSWWARLPFGVRMTMGSAAILLPLIGAGTAAVLLVHEQDTTTPDRPQAARSATVQPVRPGGLPSGVPPRGASPLGVPSPGAPDARTGLGTHDPATVAPPGTPHPARVVAQGRPGATADGADGRTGSATAPGATRSAVPAGSAGGAPTSSAPTVTTRWVAETEEIPYRTRVVRDRSLPRGEERVRTEGRNGIRTLRYEVTTVDGRQTGRKLVGTTVTRKPVTKVVAVGGRERPDRPPCSPDYDGCVPVAEDVDCAGAQGDGPLYLDGSVRVLGKDIYELDRDGNGYGCD